MADYPRHFDLDALFDFAHQLLAEAGDTPSDAARKIGKHRSTTKRALDRPDGNPTALVSIVEAYTGHTVRAYTEYELT